MTNHTLRIENHMCDPRRRRDSAEITITPPLANLAEVALAALGLNSANILIETMTDEETSMVRVETYGVIAERTAAIRLLADRISLLTTEAADTGAFSQDMPFSHEGWAALRDYVHGPDFSNTNPYYGPSDLPDYTPRRLLYPQ